MAYDVELADRVRGVVRPGQGLTEKSMFGGLAFLVGGHMALAVTDDGGLLLRVDPSATDSLLDPPEVQRFRMRGRELNGWLHVGAGAVAADDDLGRWVAIGLGYAGSLPPKGAPGSG